MATGFFSGLLGKAESAMKTRTSKIDAAEAQATSGGSDMKVQADTTQKDEKPVPRPSMSRKWTED